MVRAATSIALLVLPGLSLGQAFGRFGYVPQRTFAGICLQEDGVIPDAANGSKLHFSSALPQFKPVATSAVEQTVWLGDPAAGKPSKARLSLLTPGVSLYYDQGVTFRSTATSAPYLTWSSGSVSDGVPTPTVRWLALSFRDNQPAIILGMAEGGSFQISGEPGNWTLSAPNYKGWLRVGLPRGAFSEPTNSAASLGRLAKTCQQVAPYFATEVPQLIGFEASAEPEGNGVVGTWTFDQANVLLPQALTLAPYGGYFVARKSRAHRLDHDLGLGDGPHEVSDESVLVVRFPVRRIPIGRAIGLGDPLLPVGTVSALDIPSVVDLGWENMLAGRDAQTRKTAEDAFGAFLSEVSTTEEPFSRQRLTYDADGNGIDLTAAHAFLAQSLITSTKASSEENALLTSLAWRTDWRTWLPWVADSDRRRRTAAVASLAGALCPEAYRRVQAGMLQAGLSAERGMGVWKRESGGAESTAMYLESALPIRAALFRLIGLQDKADPFVETLLSPFRVFSGESVRLSESSGTFELSWPVLEAKAGILTVAAPTQIDLDPHANLSRCLVERILGLSEVRYTPTAAGDCVLRLTLPSYAPRPVRLVPPKPFDEIRN